VIVHGFDVYRSYLGMKLHFTKDNYDYFECQGKGRAKESTYQQRNDFYFFETLARKYSDQEIKEYLLASFVMSSDPTKVWIGDIKVKGKSNWLKWQKIHQSLSYNFQADLDKILTKGIPFNKLFDASKGHPVILKMAIKDDIMLETLIIFDMVLGFVDDWDKKLVDPLWETLSRKIKKYKPFLSIQTDKYKKVLQDTFL
jgi:hypothetical protein